MCHTQGGCGRLYSPCMHVEGLCNLCVPRLCNMYVERLGDVCVQWLRVANTVLGGTQGPCPGSDSSAVSPGTNGALVCCSVKWMLWSGWLWESLPFLTLLVLGHCGSLCFFNMCARPGNLATCSLRGGAWYY